MWLLDGDKSKIKKWKADNLFNTETMLPISEVKNGIVILKDWGLRSIIKVEWLNLDLKNYDEQQVILEQYKRFLNWLAFPIQILVRNTYLDLTEYLSYLRKNLKEIENPALKNQWDNYVKFLEWIDNQQWLIYVKEFYIIIPYYWDERDAEQVNRSRWDKFLNILNAKDDVEMIVERYRTFIKYEQNIQTRENVLISGLNDLWMSAERLDTAGAVSLLFRMYNPLLDSSQARFVD
jgi:hypothetical protein